MTKAYELRLELQSHFDIRDSKFELNAGISSAAKWFHNLSSNDQYLLVDYLLQEYSSSSALRLGDLNRVVLLARVSNNKVFIPLLEKFIAHGESLKIMCVEAINWLQPYTTEHLRDELTKAINITKEEIQNTPVGSVIYSKLVVIERELSTMFSRLDSLRTTDEEYNFNRISEKFLPYHNNLRHTLSTLDMNIRYRWSNKNG